MAWRTKLARCGESGARFGRRGRIRRLMLVLRIP